MMHNTGITSDAIDSRALSVDGSQPVWMTLNEARERAFTGEVVFELDPEVFAYLDGGVVYYAERTSDAPLGRRLLDAGVVTTEQLERGTVRVGDVEHLGRLFDRDPSVDRDAVLVVAETSTEMLIAEVANDATATVRVTAYRHHPSGVHRWFVGATDSGAARQVAPVVQLDHPIVDELPPLAAAEDLTIEWDDLEVTMASADLSIEPDGLAFFDPFVDDEFIEVSPADEMVEPLLDDRVIQVDEVDEFELVGLEEYVEQDDRDDHAEEEVQAVADDEDLEDPTPDGFDFLIKWPDGSEQVAVPANAPVEQSGEVTDEQTVELTDESSDQSADHADQSTSLAPPASTAPLSPPFTEDADGELRFDMPPLRLADTDELGEAGDDVPDDVAEAVRRAISAIESASADSASLADPLVDIEPAGGELVSADGTADRTGEAWEVTTEVAAVAAPAIGAFAPPTMDTRAEVMYAREAELDDEPTGPSHNAVQLPPAHAVASVVFVDEDPSSGGGSNERSSALRRLIGSLRRKDH